MTLKELATAVQAQRYATSTVPLHARPQITFRDNSANELTKSILAYFELIGWLAQRQASEGRYIEGKSYENVLGQKKQMKGKWIPRTKAAKGIGDIRVVGPGGLTIEIEVKYGADRQSPDQKAYQQKLEAMGGIYLIAKTWDGFFLQISKYVNEPRTAHSSTHLDEAAEQGKRGAITGLGKDNN